MWEGHGVCGRGTVCVVGARCVWEGHGVCGRGTVCVGGARCVWEGCGVKRVGHRVQ